MKLLEIEKALSGPDASSAMQRYDETLLALNVRAQAAVNAGLPPADYAKVVDLIEVVTIARKLLRLQLQKPSSSPST